MKNFTRDPPLRFNALTAAFMLLTVHFSALADDHRTKNRYTQTNLVSDQSGVAAYTDANVQNAWGIAFNPNGAVWIANNHSGTSTLYDGNGVPFPVGKPLVVKIPAGGDPTGIVFNSSKDFEVAPTFPAAFIFATESGGLAAWNPGVNNDPTNAHEIVAPPTDNEHPVYKGLALAANGKEHYLYATDFHNAKVDVFDKTFAKTTLACSFSDPNIPVDFAPFGIQNINGVLYVTYAKQNAEKIDDVAGPGLGYVDIFDADGCLVRRFASGGSLNAPWGVSLAPANFGAHSDQLLIGNFGDGVINAFNAMSGDFRGALRDLKGKKIRVDGLWGLAFGNGVLDQQTKTLFFTAGPNDEVNGLYGKIEAVKNNPDPRSPENKNQDSE
jgi:uncharacterized protein (TIGR03118 family)